MKTKKIVSMSAVAFSTLALALAANAAVIQVGNGGTANPGLSSGGTTVEDIISTTLDTTAFTNAGFFDGGSATVGGGGVSGTLYYAYTARALDREGDTFPSGLSATGVPKPSNSFAGGELVRSGSDIVGVGNNFSAYAFSIYGIGGERDFSPRIDLHPDATVTFLIEVIFNASADDTINATLYWGDPSSPISTHTRNISGDASFDAFRFRAGQNSSSTNNRWEFSDVAFATTSSEALAAVPEPSSFSLFTFVVAGCLLRRKR